MHKAKTKAIAVKPFDRDMALRFTLYMLGALLFMLLLMHPVFAQTMGPTAPASTTTSTTATGPAVYSPMARVLCNVVAMVLGDIGRGLATLAVIVVGIGAMLGKVSWGMAMTVAVGIAVVFGAPMLVGLLGVPGGGCNAGGIIMTGGFGPNGGGNPACFTDNQSGATGSTTGTMRDISCGMSVFSQGMRTADEMINILGSWR